jgi:SAM-dependent methyltransferase
MLVDRLDLDSDDAVELASHEFDTILCINVLEHTSDDAAALRRAWQLLMPGGRIIIFVPAGKDLFGTLDRGIGHQRRYEREELISLLQAAGFEVEDTVFQNRVAKLAWRLNSKLFNRNSLPAAQSKIFDRLVPLLKALDGDRPKSGLSLIAIGKKPGAAFTESVAEDAVTAPASAPTLAGAS